MNERKEENESKKRQGKSKAFKAEPINNTFRAMLSSVGRAVASGIRGPR